MTFGPVESLLFRHKDSQPTIANRSSHKPLSTTPSSSSQRIIDQSKTKDMKRCGWCGSEKFPDENKCRFKHPELALKNGALIRIRLKSLIGKNAVKLN